MILRSLEREQKGSSRQQTNPYKVKRTFLSLVSERKTQAKTIQIDNELILQIDIYIIDMSTMYRSFIDK